jgi:phosphoribosylformylglycinamidine synthase
MPHPERVFLRKQFSWLPDDYQHEEGPWLRLFQNARRWLA